MKDMGIPGLSFLYKTILFVNKDFGVPDSCFLNKAIFVQTMICRFLIHFFSFNKTTLFWFIFLK